MSGLTLSIDTGNAAFADGGAPDEIRRALGIVAGKIESGQREGFIWDSNGNRCGEWSLDLDEEGDE